jgi:transcriptional regulator GlxA family with amidase domain
MDWRICRTLAIMRQEIASPLHIATLARQMNLSSSRFSHLFRRETGQSPARYLHNHRIDCALIHLCDSTMSIKEVMAAVGFNDPSHFTRDFSERHGMSPSEFRSRAQTPDEPTTDEQSSNSRNGQQTADFANAECPDRGNALALSGALRDGRAKGA